MHYYLSETPFGTIVVRVDESGGTAFIPSDPANADYAAYLEWVSQGNTPEPWQPQEVV